MVEHLPRFLLCCSGFKRYVLIHSFNRYVFDHLGDQKIRFALFSRPTLLNASPFLGCGGCFCTLAPPSYAVWLCDCVHGRKGLTYHSVPHLLVTISCWEAMFLRRLINHEFILLKPDFHAMKLLIVFTIQSPCTFLCALLFSFPCFFGLHRRDFNGSVLLPWSIFPPTILRHDTDLPKLIG